MSIILTVQNWSRRVSVLWERAILQAKETRKKIILQKKMPFYSLISFCILFLTCTEVYEALNQLLQRSAKCYPDFMEHCWLSACLGLRVKGRKGEAGNQERSQVRDFESGYPGVQAWLPCLAILRAVKGEAQRSTIMFLLYFIVWVLAWSQN